MQQLLKRVGVTPLHITTAYLELLHYVTTAYMLQLRNCIHVTLGYMLDSLYCMYVTTCICWSYSTACYHCIFGITPMMYATTAYMVGLRNCMHVTLAYMLQSLYCIYVTTMYMLELLHCNSSLSICNYSTACILPPRIC